MKSAGTSKIPSDKKRNDRLKTLREEKGISMNQIARELKVATSTYRDWELGRRIPAESLKCLAQTLGVSLAALLGEEDEKSEQLKKAIACFEEGLALLKASLL